MHLKVICFDASVKRLNFLQSNITVSRVGGGFTNPYFFIMAQ